MALDVDSFITWWQEDKGIARFIISLSPNYKVRYSRSFSLNCKEKGNGVLILEEKETTWRITENIPQGSMLG